MSAMGFDIEHRPSASVPSLYIQTGLLFLNGAAALILTQVPAVLAPPKHNPVTLVLTHLVLLGFGTLITFGSLGQMIPVILGERIDADRYSHIAYAHLVPGIFLQVMGFAIWRPWLMAVGGSLVTVGTLIFSIPYFGPLFRRLRHDTTALFITASLIYVDLTVVLGVAMALQLHTVWSSYLLWHGLPLHVLLGGFGWFTGIIIGVSYKLFPMFTTSGSTPESNVRRVFVTYNGGLLIALVATLTGWIAGFAIGMVTVAVSFVLYITDIRQLIKRRLRRTLGAGMTQSALSLVHLAVAAVLSGVLLGASLLNPAWLSPAVTQRLIVAAGFLFGFGWIGSMVLGMLSKIVPMLVWLDLYADRAGDANVPTLAQMIDEKAVQVGGTGYQIGLAILVLAVAWGQPTIALLGATLFLFGVVYMSITIFRVWFPSQA